MLIGGKAHYFSARAACEEKSRRLDASEMLAAGIYLHWNWGAGAGDLAVVPLLNRLAEQCSLWSWLGGGQVHIVHHSDLPSPFTLYHDEVQQPLT